MMVEYIIFLSISAATSFSPGPAVFLSIRNGANYGLGKAFLWCAGQHFRDNPAGHRISFGTVHNNIGLQRTLFGH